MQPVRNLTGSLGYDALRIVGLLVVCYAQKKEKVGVPQACK